MAGVTLPRTGLVNGWVVGDNFKPDMDGNLQLLEILTGAHILDRDLTAPPGGESGGDCYIPAATATGDWAGHDGDVAYFDGTSWVFVTPWVGLSVYIGDEDVRSTYKTGGWSAGVAC